MEISEFSPIKCQIQTFLQHFKLIICRHLYIDVGFLIQYSKEQSNDFIVTFLNINVGGIQYNYAEFYFLKEKFVGAVLTKYFSINNFQTAKNYRDRIARQYGQKYRNITSEIDRNGMKYYLCGRLDYGFYPIIIDIQKSRGRDGVYRYYLKVKYNAYLIYAALESDI